MSEFGILDFAGGTVVHINAGVAGLVAAIVVGKPGCAPAMPYPDDLKTFLAQHPGPSVVKE